MLDRMCKFVVAAALAFAARLFLRGTTNEVRSSAPNHVPQSECTFSDGSTRAFGPKASGTTKAVADSWRAGDYEATAFRVSERMVIPPMDSPIEILAGSYTLFVKDQGKPPWALIVSKKIGQWGMPYPGEQYDLGRTSLGSDVQSPMEKFIIGCTQHLNAPIFVWMQSGRYVGYAKIMAVKITEGKTEYFWH
jgi:hypothetical protein